MVSKSVYRKDEKSKPPRDDLICRSFCKSPFGPNCSAAELLASFKQNDCDIFIEYVEHPESIQLVFREEALNAAMVIGEVQAVCAQYQKVLELDL